MRWVPHAVMRPNRCAMVPFIGQDPGGFFDAGTEIMALDGHVYVSHTAFREMARIAGWEPVRVESRARVTDLEAELAEVTAERDSLREKFAAIDVLASEGFRARKAPGRPRKKEEVV